MSNFSDLVCTFVSKKKFLKSQDQMNLQELEDKRNWLMKCLERGRIV